jgi:hypothetical protein
VGEGGETEGIGAELTQVGVQGGAATEAPLARPEQILLDEVSDRLFIADTGNSLVQLVDLASGLLGNVAGSSNAGANPPTSSPQVATEVRLQRPVGLALDRNLNHLFVADRAAKQILEVRLSETGPGLLSVIAEAPLESPELLLYHEFPEGQRVLFILDHGKRNAAGDPGTFTPPRLFILDPDTGDLDDLEIDVPLRLLSGIAGRDLGSGGFDLLIAADIGEDLGYCGSACPDLAADLSIEANLYDGIDNDFDGFTDFADVDDAQTPLQVQVLRIHLTATDLDFSGDSVSVAAEKFLSGFRRVQIVDLDPEPGCGPLDAATTPPSDIQDLLIAGMYLDASGRLVLLNPVDECVHVAGFGEADAFLSSTRVAGVVAPEGEPFDGEVALETRFFRPRGVTLDSLDNLYVVDTGNSRIRRAWVGDTLAQP